MALRAPVGYVNNKENHTIEPDPVKGPFVVKLFEWYASGDFSLDRLSKMARGSGLFSRNSLVINKGGIHRILRNPVYYGEFVWKGKRYVGVHKPLISKQLFDDVQAVFDRANRPKETKRSFAFAGLLTCGQCGCAMTPEIKKGKYVYCHCTRYLGECDNVYIREENVSDLLAEVVKRVYIDWDTVEDIRRALLASQQDKVAYHSSAVQALQDKERRLLLLIDRAYEDKLYGKISEDLWQRKSTTWNDELVDVRLRLKAHQTANFNYYETGNQILELANRAYGLYLRQNRQEQRKLLDSLLSYRTFYRGTLCPTYKKPFDILARRAEFQSMRG